MPFEGPKKLLVESFLAAVAAADPLQLIAGNTKLPDAGRTLVVGGGKAAASMALALERAFPERRLEGLVSTRYLHGLPTSSIRVVEAGHPVPDDAGARASEEMLALAGSLGADDLMVALVSGGASSIMSCPAEGLDMTDLSALNRSPT